MTIQRVNLYGRNLTADLVERPPVAVYGTLRHVDGPGGGNYWHFLHGKTIAEQPGTVSGARMYDYGGFPFVRLVESKEELVVVEVMSLDPGRYDEILAAMDRLEGYRPNGGGLYDRKTVTVDVDGEQVEALMYVVGERMSKQVESLPVIRSGDWLDSGRRRGVRAAGDAR